MHRNFRSSRSTRVSLRAALSWLLIALTAYQSGIAAMGSFAVVVDDHGRAQVLCTFQGLRAAPGVADSSGQRDDRLEADLLCPAALLAAVHGDALPGACVDVDVAACNDGMRLTVASSWTPGAPAYASPIRAPPRAPVPRRMALPMTA